jgi:hypothetical protein
MEAATHKSYKGPALSLTISREGNRVHRLIDDTIYPLRATTVVVRRDPMVAALFGAAARQVARTAPAKVKQTAPAR